MGRGVGGQVRAQPARLGVLQIGTLHIDGIAGDLFTCDKGACNTVLPTCTANEFGVLAFWNYRIGTFDNLTLRTEFYDDMKGQRTGYATRYIDIAAGWQHWIGPQVEIRPEIGYYRAPDGRGLRQWHRHRPPGGAFHG